MTDTKITPEEAAALYTKFVEDSEAYMKERDWLADYEEDADKHALSLAVSRERERCARIAENPAIFSREKGEKIRSGE